MTFAEPCWHLPGVFGMALAKGDNLGQSVRRLLPSLDVFLTLRSHHTIPVGSAEALSLPGVGALTMYLCVTVLAPLFVPMAAFAANLRTC